MKLAELVGLLLVVFVAGSFLGIWAVALILGAVLLVKGGRA